jgi:hypothetical protein
MRFGHSSRDLPQCSTVIRDSIGSVEKFVRVLTRYHVKVFVRVPMPGFNEPGMERVVGDTIRMLAGCLAIAYSISADSRLAAFAIDERFCGSTQTRRRGAESPRLTLKRLLAVSSGCGVSHSGRNQ